MLSARCNLVRFNLTEVESGSPAQVLQDLNLPAVASESFSGFAMDILPDAQQGNWKMRTLVKAIP